MRTLKTAAMALALPGILAASVPAGAAVAGQASVSGQELGIGGWQHGRRSSYYDEGNGRRYYDEPVYSNTRVWRGDDGRYYCRKKDGTVGLIVGGAAGALIGREIAGRGDRTLGAILGGAGGALLGREIDRSSSSSRCR